MPTHATPLGNLTRQLSHTYDSGGDVNLPGSAASLSAYGAALAGTWDGWTGRVGGYDPARRMPKPVRSLLDRALEIFDRVKGTAQ